MILNSVHLLVEGPRRKHVRENCSRKNWIGNGITVTGRIPLTTVSYSVMRALVTEKNKQEGKKLERATSYQEYSPHTPQSCALRGKRWDLLKFHAVKMWKTFIKFIFKKGKKKVFLHKALGLVMVVVASCYGDVFYLFTGTGKLASYEVKTGQSYK